MSDPGFIHLRVHSAYSLLEGAIRIPDLAQRCAKMGMPAVAITDTVNLFGVMEFVAAARARGVQPIVGAQITLTPDDIGARHGAPPETLALLAQDRPGLLNLMGLLSDAWLTPDANGDATLSLDALEANSAGLICLTGGAHGPIGRALLDGRADAAAATLERLATLYPGRLYVELQRHDLPEENQTEDALVDLAHRYDLPLVATNECFFLTPNNYEAHDALLCIADGAYVSEADRRRVTPEHWFKPPEAMRALFADLPEAVANTVVIARRCHATPETRAPMLPPYPKLEGRSGDEALLMLAQPGLERRLDEEVLPPVAPEDRARAAAPYRARLAYEAGIISQMGFAGYFLIVADFVRWAKENGIPVGPGRGSGAGSVTAWALDITDLDPLRFGLLFERFLNPERVSMPDFDIDFCPEGRDAVILYVQREYGADRVAQIITFGTLQARAAVRDVGRVLQMPYGQVDRIAKLVPHNPAKPVTLSQALESEPALRQECDRDPAVARLLATAIKLEGLHRHASTHAAGVVIADRPLRELAPLYRDPRATMAVTQFNMTAVEDVGLVKFDFLGLKTLTVIARAKALIDADPEQKTPLNLKAIPFDDPEVYAMLCAGETTGVFQMESSGMRAVLRDLRPDRFEDLIAAVALYRPGPMDNIPSYVRRKHGLEPAGYLHPLLEPVLRETYGIPVYQEQVMQMAQTLAGYPLGAADLLRRAMGKKKKAEMDQQRRAFLDGAAKLHRIEPSLANAIFDQMAAFAGYGFNKSHAAAYALIAWWTAWLKVRHPVAFLAASLSSELRNTDRLDLFRTEASRQGVRILAPDVNRSGVAFTVEKTANGARAIRYGLAAIRAIGEGAAEAIVRARDDCGPFRHLDDIAARIYPAAVGKRTLEALAAAGALDTLNRNRHQSFEAAESLIRAGTAARRGQEEGQESLFGFDTVAAPLTLAPLPQVEDWNAAEKLEHEREAFGFYLSGHPLDAWRDACAALDVASWADVESGRVPTSQGVTLAGIVTGRRTTRTARGGRMVFLALSDASGGYEVTVFEEVLNTTADALASGAPLLLRADVQRRGEGQDAALRLTALAITPLTEALDALPSRAPLRLTVADATALPPLAQLLTQRGRPGATEVQLQIKTEHNQQVVIGLATTIAADAALKQALRGIPGLTCGTLTAVAR